MAFASVLVRPGQLVDDLLDVSYLGSDTNPAPNAPRPDADQWRGAVGIDPSGMRLLIKEGC